MGPYGVHHERNQTWWPMVDSYHKYVSRCQYILQQGQTVADILYLTPEGAPNGIPCPGTSALTEEIVLDSSLVLISRRGKICRVSTTELFFLTGKAITSMAVHLPN